jgi:hypothetical protein
MVQETNTSTSCATCAELEQREEPKDYHCRHGRFDRSSFRGAGPSPSPVQVIFELFNMPFQACCQQFAVYDTFVFSDIAPFLELAESRLMR